MTLVDNEKSLLSNNSPLIKLGAPGDCNLYNYFPRAIAFLFHPKLTFIYHFSYFIIKNCIFLPTTWLWPEKLYYILPLLHGISDGRIVDISIGHDLKLLCYSFPCRSLGKTDGGAVGFLAINTPASPKLWHESLGHSV